MRLERERPDGRRDFWDARVNDATLVIRTGIVNMKQRVSEKHYPSAKDANAALEKIAADKRKQGFGEPIILGAKFLPGKFPRNPALEAAIREDRSEGPCSVYADWLQAQGSPAGEVMALATAIAKKRSDARKQARLDELALELLLPTTDYATWTWNHGIWASLKLENLEDWMDDKFDAVTLANKLFATPFCVALQELHLGILRWDYNSTDVPAVLDAAGGHAWAKGLARLHLGEIGENIDMAHQAVGDVGGVISLAFPKLQHLKVHSGERAANDTFSLAGLALPKLETLIVETCAMTKPRLDAILRAKLPSLKRLELWFGASDRDAGASLDDLAPLLDGSVFPKVTHLGLKNLDFTGPLTEALYGSKIAPRLVELDLSMGTLDGDYVTDFYVHAANFKKLRVLNVDDNFLTPRELRELRGSFKAKVVSEGQPKLDDGDEGRFVSVAE